jgi:hypothetical protein
MEAVELRFGRHILVYYSSTPYLDVFGIGLCIWALGYMFFIIGRTLFFGVDVPDYSSIVVMILFFSGMNMIGLGVIGEYLGRIFVEVKQRPLYVIRETHGFNLGFSGKRTAIETPPAPVLRKEIDRH